MGVVISTLKFYSGEKYRMPITIMAAQKISEEVDRGNAKHGDGHIASDLEAIAILVEELGEYSAAVMQGNVAQAQKELTQIAAVAANHLGGGLHFTNKK
jgi:hypothetical protein